MLQACVVKIDLIFFVVWMKPFLEETFNFLYLRMRRRRDVQLCKVSYVEIYMPINVCCTLIK